VEAARAMKRNAVLLIADENQFAPAVFLAHRLAALRGDRTVDIVLATNSPGELARAKQYVGPFEVIDVSRLHADLALPPVRYFTRATYLSLFVPALLVGHYDRLLYLDIDTYVESDNVFRFFDLDLAGNAVAAIRDLTVPFFANAFNSEELYETLRLPQEDWPGAKYLNSGVLLFDLRAYRRDKIESEALRVIREGKVRLRLPDQTVFNAVLRTRWLELSPSFNMIAAARASPIREFSPPVILHFSGEVKPWHATFPEDHPVKQQIPAFLKDTPWSSFIADVNRPRQLVGQPAPATPAPDRPFWHGHELRLLIRYLVETKFADVEQGITRLNYAALGVRA
jgi:lipopolysaccharide biosynthesis glycosyltransferase